MKTHVLVAEDELLVALALADCLEAAGHTVALAPDGAEALKRAAAGPSFDALVTDLHMPRLDGEGLIRALRTRLPGLPVVVLTGSAPPGGAAGLRRRGGGHGPLVLLCKPLDPARLVDALRQVLGTAGRGAAAGARLGEGGLSPPMMGRDRPCADTGSGLAAVGMMHRRDGGGGAAVSLRRA